MGEAISVSADGKTIVGNNYGTESGYIWNAPEGTIFISDDNPDAITIMTAISDDAKTELGFSFDPTESILLGRGFIWTKDDGKKFLDDVVSELGYDNLGIEFSVPSGISPDGKFIGGIGVNYEEMDAKGFVIKLPGANLATAAVKAQAAVKVFPNPVKDVATLKANGKITGAEVYNTAGQLVFVSKNVVNNQIDLNQLPKGVYILKVATDLGTTTTKLLKQ